MTSFWVCFLCFVYSPLCIFHLKKKSSNQVIIYDIHSLYTSRKKMLMDDCVSECKKLWSGRMNEEENWCLRRRKKSNNLCTIFDVKSRSVFQLVSDAHNWIARSWRAGWGTPPNCPKATTTCFEIYTTKVGGALM